MDRQRSQERDSNLLSLCPREMNILKFVEARAAEMETMSLLISGRGMNPRAMQLLPIHIRRRAMSHNTKRFPKRWWPAAEEEQSMLTTKPIARARRELRRSRENKRNRTAHEKHGVDSDWVWLRTHIWHAKRFHMKKVWGRCMPDFSNEKCLRKVYRGANTATLVQDLSYLALFEIVGEQGKMLEALTRMTNANCGSKIDDPQFMSGKERGLTNLYKADEYPDQCVGPVTFLWMTEGANSDLSPLINVSPEQRKLWLWTHPACSGQVLGALRLVEEEQYGCHLSQIKENLSMFRVMGGGCWKTVSDILVSGPKREVNDVSIGDVAVLSQRRGGGGMDVFSVMVKYPRLHRVPCGRTEMEMAEIEAQEAPSSLPEHEPLSPLLWSDEARETFNADVAEKTKGHSLRNNLNLSEDIGDEATLPILLMRMRVSGHRALDGWDIVVPSSAAMLVWKAFIFHSSRALGQREWHSVCKEYGFMIYPYSHPDSDAGKVFASTMAETAKNDYDRRPPSKRTNYTAMNVADPFACPWTKLIGQWNTESEGQFHVLREANVLRRIQHALDNQTASGLNLTNTLLPVTVSMMDRGNLIERSMIAMPSAEDLENKDENSSDPSEVVSRSRPAGAGRPIIGYLYSAGFTLSHGRCMGQGFVAFNGLETLLKTNKDCRVLVRTPNTLQYRFGRLNICFDANTVL